MERLGASKHLVAIRIERDGSQIESHLRNLSGFYKDIGRQEAPASKPRREAIWREKRGEA